MKNILNKLAIGLLCFMQAAQASPPITWGSSGSNPAAKLFTNYLCFLDNTCYSSSSIGVAGSDKQIQYNDGGVQAGDSALNWDKTNDALGIQTSAPLHPLHVVAETGTQINSVTTGSVTTASETLNTSPTGAVTLIAEFSATSGSTTSQNLSGSGYIATGQTIDYQIYQAIQGTNGTIYASSNAESISFTDSINDSTTPFSVNLSITGIASDTTHLVILKQINGGGFNDSTLISVNPSYEDSNFSGIVSYASWPTNYVLSYTTPTAPSAISAQETNLGAGSLFENGTTYNVEIRSVANVSGIYYAEQTGDVMTPFTDNNMGSQFDLQIDWTPGGGDDQIVRISTDGGSNWTYHFVGGMGSQFIYSGQGNDSTAETAWTNNISGVQKQYAFKAYASQLSPSNNVVYTPSADTYYATLTTPNVYYIFKHVLTGFNTSAKVFGDYNTGVTNGLNITNATLIDPGYTTWGDGTTITPTTYGFSNGTTRYFKMVGTNGTIFSPTPLVVNATTSGSGKYFTGSFTYPSGVSTVKILISSDGSTYTGSKTFTSPTNTFTFDSTDNTWGGNTTIAPTASVPAAVRIDRSMTSVSDVPNLLLTDITGSGSRYSGLGFGWASSKSGSHTTQSNILGEVTTGYLKIGASRLAGYTNSAQTTESWMLGNAVQFNLQKSSSVHTTVWGADANAPMMYAYSAGDTNRGTVYFGDDTTSFGSGSKVVISPTAGGTTSLHLRHASGAGSVDAVLIDEAGSFRGGWKKDGSMYLGATTYDSGAILTIGANSSRAHLKLNTNSSPATNEDGGIYFTTPTFFGTDGTTSRAFVRTSSTSLLTSGRVPFATTGGFLTDDSDFTFATDTLTATKIQAPTNLTVGSGTPITKVLSASATLDFPSIAAQTCDESLTITVTGAATGNVVSLGPPSGFENGLSATGYVSASNTVKVRLCNVTSGSIDPASASWRAMVTAF